MILKLTLISCLIVACVSINLKQDDLLGKGCVWLFEECQFQGQKFEICKDYSNLDAFTDFNGKAKSVKAGPDTGVMLYSKTDFKGSKLTLDGYLNCYNTDSLVQSIKILTNN
jgi:hypothetical protein